MEKILKKTKGFCPTCREMVGAVVFEADGNIFIRKDCPRDGSFENLYFWPRLDLYRSIGDLYRGKPKGHPIALLIYLNYDCNQSCNFCFSDGNKKDTPEPSVDDVIDRTSNFKGQYIYLCGGEPTLRSDLFEIIRRLKEKRFKVILMTNGKRLTDESYIRGLEKTGLDIIQLQFDTLDDRHYNILRQEDLLDIKLKVVHNLKRTKILLQLWVMLVKGVNDNQIGNIFRYAAENSDIIKTVFFIPAWSLGRNPGHRDFTKTEVLEILEKESGISEDDFVTYTVFDFYVSELFNFFINKNFNRSSMCNVDCHFLVIDGAITPLVRLIDLKKINNFLRKIYQRLNERPFPSKWYIALKIAYFFLVNPALFNIRLLPFMFRTILSSSRSFFNKQYPVNRYRSSFHVRVGSFVEPSNSDIDIFKHCNIFSDYRENLFCHCFSEILKDSRQP